MFKSCKFFDEDKGVCANEACSVKPCSEVRSLNLTWLFAVVNCMMAYNQLFNVMRLYNMRAFGIKKYDANLSALSVDDNKWAKHLSH